MGRPWTTSAKEIIPQAEGRHHHIRERYVGSRGSGEAGHSVGMHARQKGWECQRWLGRLHQANGNQGAYWATKRKATFVFKKKCRRGRASRRLAKKTAHKARKRPKDALGAVGMYNVRTLVVKGKNGYGHVLSKGRQLGCNFSSLQEPRKSSSTTFRAAGYRVFWSA